jgi:hypothetical protein
MLLIVSIALAFVPLLGITWILTRGSITTVDGLFMSLILLAMSGIFAANAYWEFRRWRARVAVAMNAPRVASQQVAVYQSGGGSVVRGRIQSVEFFEAHVGQVSKSVVILSNGSGSSRILVLAGDLRNRLPAGKRVELTFRRENDLPTLLAAAYS